MVGRALFVAAAAALMLGLAAPAVLASPLPMPGHEHAGAQAAYFVQGRRWPGRPARIPYHATVYKAAVHKAAAAWNRSGARLRFVAVSRRRARVVVRYFGRRASAICDGRGAGCAHLGYSPRRRVSSVWLARGLEPHDAQWLAVHELGHILGLGHSSRCAAMYPYFGFELRNLCSRRPLPSGQYRCPRLLERDDIRGVVKLYGGRARFGREICVAPLVPAPAGASARIEGGEVLLSWTNPASQFFSRVEILRRTGACPTGRDDPEARLVRAGWSAPGEAQTITDWGADTGDLCYRLWSIDVYDRPSPSPTTVRLNGFIRPEAPAW